ncbi:MAG: C4-type zinc ribbon domain-containing protein [Simkaniaceae bacterium]|nr:C4-type zinc ribbon domain-containing protein [Simkaniaceae bacterium]
MVTVGGMYQGLRILLDIQEMDIKMIRLMRVKKQRQGELEQIEDLRRELKEQLDLKRKEIVALADEVSATEGKIVSLTEKHKALEEKQSVIKKVEEFNALTHEMTAVEREKVGLEGQASRLLDKKNAEEEVYEKINKSLEDSAVNSRELEEEIKAGIERINEEGRRLKEQRERMVQQADPEILAIYERLLRNKKDRVIVPIENRACSGCHITLTLQHENLVHKGDGLVFCEHCSRIHYRPDSEAPSATERGGATSLTPAKRRRRRATINKTT